MTATSLVWFRNDLRLDDNPAWAEASRTSDGVVPVFVAEPRLVSASGPHRLRSLIGHLAALDARLTAMGGRLHVIDGPAEAAIPALVERWAADRVHCNADVTPYARRRDEAVGRSVDLVAGHGRYVHAAGSVTRAGGGSYRVFTPFYRRWQQQRRSPWPASRPVTVNDDAGRGVASIGEAPSGVFGEEAARGALHRFLERADGYAQDRDRIDLVATSRLSQHLRFGTISPRAVVDAGAGREAFVRQVAWREFCAQLLLAEPELPKQALRPEFDAVAWRADPSGFEAWRRGETGYPIVDAAMRQLRAEGWMSNRLRMIAASFLVKDLLIDWRFGERHFRRWLVDGDLAQNVVNWQWVASVGVDTAPYFRVMNPVTQAKRFDPSGDYVRSWVPELARLPGSLIHSPWEIEPGDLSQWGVTLGETYPRPIVDHATARAEAIAAYEAAVTGR